MAAFCLHKFVLHRNEASSSLEYFNVASELDPENFTSCHFKVEHFDKNSTCVSREISK